MTDFAQPQPFVSSRVRRMRMRALMRKIYPVILFILVLLIIALLFNYKTEAVSQVKVQAVHAQEIASPSATPIVIVQEDKRVAILHDYLEAKNSPLTAYSEYFVEISDKYGLDWTLMPAIAGMESSFGLKMPKESNNPFGLGGGKLMSFPTLYDSIAYEGKLLSQHYKLAANHAIGSIYCPTSECNQNWAFIVTNFSEEILN